MLAASNDDNENTALRASDGLYKSSRLKLPMLTNRRIHRGDEARKPDGTQLTRDKRYHINHLQKYRQAKRGSAFGITARELAQSTGALTSHSNNQFQPLPPDAPLPPVPSPRKSKSYTDLHSRCTNNAQVASTNTNVWDTTRVSWKSLENATSSMPSANGTQRNCSIDDIYCHQVRDGTWQKMSLWQSKSLDSNRRKFGRRGITLNSAKNEHQSSEQPGWLRSSGRKLIQGLNRLRNTVRGKGQSETIDSPSTALPSLDCRRRIISPELPTPQLLIANQHTQKDERRPSPINNYLPMSPNTDDDLYSDAQGQKETTLDEKGRLDWPPKSRESIYTEHTPMKTDTKSNTSRSTNWAVQNPNQTSIAINPSRPTKNVISNGSTADQSLYLSENLYQWSFLDDDGDSARKESEEAKYLPLAPPPPSMNTSPAPSRGQNNGYNRQGVAQNTLAPAPLILPRAPLPPPAAPPLARPAPPLAPKPRHVIPGHVMKLVHGTPPPQNKPVGR